MIPRALWATACTFLGAALAVFALPKSSGGRLPAVQETPPLKLVATVALPGVQGRIDHLALDSTANRLFVAALGNNSVEIVDLSKGLRTGQIANLEEPQGVLFLSDPDRLLATNGEGASLSIFRGDDLGDATRVRLRADPDNIRIEAEAKRVWVGEGGGSQGALAALDAETGQLSFEIPLDGHPESFQLETRGPRIFVNVPSEREVEVIDRQRRQVVDRWRIPHAANFPMAIDERRGRILVGCRRPARILVLDIGAGKSVGDVAAPGDADDIFIDQARDRVYVSGGEGFVRVYHWTPEGELQTAGDVSTGRGARTSLFDRSARRLYVAVPRSGTTEAKILVFLAN